MTTARSLTKLDPGPVSGRLGRPAGCRLAQALLPGLLVLGSGVSAQDLAYVDMATQGHENISYGYADVLRAQPTYVVVRHPEICDEAGDGPADASTSIMTSLAAAASGRSDAGPGEDRPAPACEVAEDALEERKIVGYDVEYRYKGELYMSRMDYDPGNKLRVRVTVAPAD